MRVTTRALALSAGLSLLVPAVSVARAPTSYLCPPYKAGGDGAGQTTLVVRDDATESDPLETTLAVASGLGPTGDDPPPTVSRSFINVQANSLEPKIKLFVRADFGLVWDIDLYLRAADGRIVAAASGFNPLPPLDDGTGQGGHSEQGVEQIDGKMTKDCGGYTIELAGAATIPQDVRLYLWLASRR